MNWQPQRVLVPLIFVFSVLACSCATAQFQEEPDVLVPMLRTRLLERKDLDQETRAKAIQSMGRSLNGKPDPELLRDMRDVNVANANWLKDYLADHHWPTITEVGKDGAHAAWIIVQHADHDRRFQQDCLAKMQDTRKESPEEIIVVDLAYLTDRLLVAAGREQRFGTQVVIEDGQFTPVQIENRAELDARRERLGLQSMDEYLLALRQNYARTRGSTQNR